jgi:RimJ/RimL family protein N-acetyltransferase
MPELKTKRLRLVPMTTAQLGELISQPQPDPHFAAALREMYDACVAHPDAWLFNTNWQIYLRTDVTCIGKPRLQGRAEKRRRRARLRHRRAVSKQGYAVEAVKAAMNWAFYRQDVYF